MGTVSTAELAGGLAAVEAEVVAQGAKVKRGAWSEAFAAKTA